MRLTFETEQEEDGRWIAESPEIPGVMAYGATKAEAIAKAEALALRALAERFAPAGHQPEIARGEEPGRHEKREPHADADRPDRQLRHDAGAKNAPATAAMMQEMSNATSTCTMAMKVTACTIVGSVWPTFSVPGMFSSPVSCGSSRRMRPSPSGISYAPPGKVAFA